MRTMRFDRPVGFVRRFLLLPACLLVGLALPSARGFWPGDPAPPRRTQCSLAVAPVELELARLDAATPGATFRVRLVARAQAACDDAALTLELPPGAALVSGVPGWRGALARGEQRVLVVRARVPDLTPRRFFGIAEVRKGAAKLLRQTHLEVGRPPGGLSAPRFDNVITAPDGTRMMVLPAREVSP